MAVTHTSGERIGIDESGNGDYVGPLVIAAVFVDAITQHELALIQVRDNNKISDARTLDMAPDIKTICPHRARRHRSVEIQRAAREH